MAPTARARTASRYDSRPGVWRSLVARSVRVGEAPSSNLGTPIRRRAGGAEPGRRVPPRSGAAVPVLALSSNLGAPRGRLRRRLHPRAARPRPGARRLPRARAPLRALARPRALRRGARGRLRRGQAPSRARPRRGDLGAVHRADHRGDGRGGRHLRRRRRDGAPLDPVGALRALRRRAAGARGSARPGDQDRPALELGPRSRRVRRPPRSRCRRSADLGQPRQDEAAPHDLPRHARAARGRPRPRR